jgi:hypothetical protein
MNANEDRRTGFVRRNFADKPKLHWSIIMIPIDMVIRTSLEVWRRVKLMDFLEMMSVSSIFIHKLYTIPNDLHIICHKLLLKTIPKW